MLTKLCVDDNNDMSERMESKSPVKSELEAYLESHPEFIQTWLKERASPETRRKVLTCCSTTPVIATTLSERESRSNNETINTSSLVNNNNNSSAVNNNTVRGGAGSSSSPGAEQATSILVTESPSSSSNHTAAGTSAKGGGGGGGGGSSGGGSGASTSTASSSSCNTVGLEQQQGHDSCKPSGATPQDENNDEITPVQRPRSHSKRNSITSDRFQSWIASSPKHKADRAVPPGLVRGELDHLDENELFIELVKDISNELDIDILCHKILVNVGYLTQADRCSLFLARGPSDKRHLVAKLWDVTIDSGT